MTPCNQFRFWACPFAALGSGYSALRYRFGATLRYALPDGMLRIPHASCYQTNSIYSKINLVSN
ncbi:MAG: hypothetical protein NZ455_03910 [Bacteroidia bacterium]|nr:hypothetical protein [Bacteroidia bacterium]MDW8348010.1 hypothetical protein [Bacteroidia bacterium]